MTNNTQNPLTGNGNGPDSCNWVTVIVSFVTFYPRIRGEINCLEIIQGPNESLKDAVLRTKREAYRFAEDDRDATFSTYMNLSTEGYCVAEVVCLKVNGRLFLPYDFFDDIVLCEDEDFSGG